jgi:type I restriction enzyme S subunit
MENKPFTDLPMDLPELPDDWVWHPLGDLLENDRGISYGVVQPGSDDPSGIPIIRVNNIKNGHLVLDDVKRISTDIEKHYSRTRLRGGEVLITLVGSLGECVVVPHELSGWNLARAVGLIPVHPDIDPRWITYALKLPLVQHYVQTWANTTVQATLNLADVQRLPIPLPPEATITETVNILSVLDEKIDLNRRLNVTLEAIARAQFKSWFVDFDPVYFKAEGWQPECLDPETSALFPDSFEDSEIGQIPVGWQLAQIGDAVSVVGGSTPSTKEPSFWDNGTINWVTPKDLSGLESPVLLTTDRQITQLGLEQISSGLLPAGTVLLSSRAPVGYLVISEIPVAINQGFIAMICDGPLSNFYTLFWTEANMDAIKARASGTTFQEISKRNFRPIPVLIPPPKILQAFDYAVTPIYQRIASNLREINVLGEIRDTLLPKLISGEVRL